MSAFLCRDGRFHTYARQNVRGLSPLMRNHPLPSAHENNTKKPQDKDDKEYKPEAVQKESHD